MTTKSCFACRYHGLHHSDDLKILHLCRKNPPTVQLMLIPTREGPQLRDCCAWPQVRDTDWCGYFEPVMSEH